MTIFYKTNYIETAIKDPVFLITQEWGSILVPMLVLLSPLLQSFSPDLSTRDRVSLLGYVLLAVPIYYDHKSGICLCSFMSIYTAELYRYIVS